MKQGFRGIQGISWSTVRAVLGIRVECLFLRFSHNSASWNDILYSMICLVWGEDFLLSAHCGLLHRQESQGSRGIVTDRGGVA